MKKSNCLRIVAAAGGAIALASAASAQPFVINLSGATLLQNTLNFPAGTNDYIDVDGDGVSGLLTPANVDQLAPTGLPPAPGTPPNNQWWIVQYRITGSVNGFQELIDWGGEGVTPFATGGDLVEIFSTNAADGAVVNRTQYIASGGGGVGPFNAGNPGGAPVRSTMNGSYTATYASPPNAAPGGIQIDVAPLDVPASWGPAPSSARPRSAAPPWLPAMAATSAPPPTRTARPMGLTICWPTALTTRVSGRRCLTTRGSGRRCPDHKG